MIRSLRHRNFRLYFFGQVLSLNGTWMQSVAQSWLVYRLTGSGTWLGAVMFANLIPVLLLSLLGGVVADRFDRRRLMLLLHFLAMLQAVTLATATLQGWVTPPLLLLLALWLGLVHAFEVPARHALMASLVPRADLPNAIALNSSAFNIARTVGPALAGALVAWVGEGWVFALNAATFLGVLAGLAWMRVDARPSGEQRGSAWQNLKEGLGYVRSHPTIRAVILLVALLSMVAAVLTVLMPLVVDRRFGGQSLELGLFLGAVGLGALLGAINLARKRGGRTLLPSIARAALLAGAGLLLFPLVSWQWLALPILVVIGFGQTTVAASTNTYIQMEVPDLLRGRVMSIFSTLFIGLMPLGSLLGGAVGDWLGPVPTVVAAGMAMLAGGLLFLARCRPCAAGGR